MIDSAALAAWTARLSRIIVRWMTIYGVPTTRAERWAMARRLHPEVEAERRRIYQETVRQIREERPNLRPAPLREYRVVALVAAIERATNAEPPPRPAERTDRSERAAAAQPEQSPRNSEPADRQTDANEQPDRATDDTPSRSRASVTGGTSAAPSGRQGASVTGGSPAGRRQGASVTGGMSPAPGSRGASVFGGEPPAGGRRGASVTGSASPAPRSRRGASVTGGVAPADLDPQSRKRSKSRVLVTDDNRTDPAVVREVSERVSATVERHVRQADRETVTATANGAGDEIGWARVLSGAENCAFCAMLASRGPVYRSDKSAISVVGDRRGRTRGTRELGESYHDHCDCSAVLVRDGETWDGREEFERLERLWAAASAAAPTEAQRTFNRAWRRIQREPDLEDEFDRIWAESTVGLTGRRAVRAFADAVKENPPAALEAARRPRRAPE